MRAALRAGGADFAGAKHEKLRALARALRPAKLGVPREARPASVADLIGPAKPHQTEGNVPASDRWRIHPVARKRSTDVDSYGFHFGKDGHDCQKDRSLRTPIEIVRRFPKAGIFDSRNLGVGLGPSEIGGLMMRKVLGRCAARRERSWLIGMGLLGIGAVAGVQGGALAAPGPVTQSGLPLQIVPTYPETGAPAFNFQGGAAFGGGGVSPGGGDGGGVPTGVGDGGGGNSGPVANLPPNATLDQVAQQDYIQSAAAAGGISPDALAATCLAESNCQNIGAGAGSSASGEFQMINSTYTAMINEFAADHPDIQVDSSLAGKMDPQNEAYAAAQYLQDGVDALQAAGVPNPTNVDLRGYYQFGPTSGAYIAQAPPSANLENIVNLTPAQMAANGITATTTVGQWQQTYANKVGAVAYQATGV